GGHLEVVEKLLAEGADANAAALQAAAWGGHLEVVEKLLAAGADVNAAAGYDGWTALEAAAEGGHLEVVEKLLAKGANANAAALEAAAGGGHLEVVEKLLAKGANVNAAAKAAKRLLAAGADEDRIRCLNILSTSSYSEIRGIMEDVLEHVNDEPMADDGLLKPIDATEALKGLAPFEALITRALKRNTWKMIKNLYHRAVLVGSSNAVEALKTHGVNPTNGVYSLLPAALLVIKNVPESTVSWPFISTLL
ncbi:hypothetical protein NW763_014837, partial [Fusarium oxysporum]